MGAGFTNGWGRGGGGHQQKRNYKGNTTSGFFSPLFLQPVPPLPPLAKPNRKPTSKKSETGFLIPRPRPKCPSCHVNDLPTYIPTPCLILPLFAAGKPPCPHYKSLPSLTCFTLRNSRISRLWFHLVIYSQKALLCGPCLQAFQSRFKLLATETVTAPC